MHLCVNAGSLNYYIMQILWSFIKFWSQFYYIVTHCNAITQCSVTSSDFLNQMMSHYRKVSRFSDAKILQALQKHSIKVWKLYFLTEWHHQLQLKVDSWMHNRKGTMLPSSGQDEKCFVNIIAYFKNILHKTKMI